MYGFGSAFEHVANESDVRQYYAIDRSSTPNSQYKDAVLTASFEIRDPSDTDNSFEQIGQITLTHFTGEQDTEDLYIMALEVKADRFSDFKHILAHCFSNLETKDIIMDNPALKACYVRDTNPAEVLSIVERAKLITEFQFSAFEEMIHALQKDVEKPRTPWPKNQNEQASSPPIADQPRIFALGS